MKVKEKVLEAAKQLYAECGYQGLSMRKVAKLAGVSTMASYRHYESKDHLLHALQVFAFSFYAEKHLEPLLEIEDPDKALRAVMSAYADFAEQDTEYFKIAFMATDELQGLKTLTAEGKETIERAFRLPLDIVARAVGKERAMTEMLRAWSTCHGMIALHLAGRLRFLDRDFRAFYDEEMDSYVARLLTASNA